MLFNPSSHLFLLCCLLPSAICAPAGELTSSALDKRQCPFVPAQSIYKSTGNVAGNSINFDGHATIQITSTNYYFWDYYTRSYRYGTCFHFVNNDCGTVSLHMAPDSSLLNDDNVARSGEFRARAAADICYPTDGLGYTVTTIATRLDVGNGGLNSASLAATKKGTERPKGFAKFGSKAELIASCKKGGGKNC